MEQPILDANDQRAAEAARAALLARLHKERHMNVGHWTRDELYEDER